MLHKNTKNCFENFAHKSLKNLVYKQYIITTYNKLFFNVMVGFRDLTNIRNIVK